MTFISDKFQNEKLDKYHINVKTKYVVGNNILERNTNGSINDDILNGVIQQKEYYLNDKLIHKETNFDTRMEYTFISKKNEEKNISCPNCGMTLPLKKINDGCPYCGTYYNLDYSDKELGGKHYYDYILKSNTYRVIVAIISLLISSFFSYLFVKNTSRTFNSIDIIKVFVYGTILAVILYYIFYTLDAYLILTPVKKYKQKLNQKQKNFWNRTKIDKKTFFNNLNYEIRKYYYQQEKIIDYDILDYISYEDYTKDDVMYVKVQADVRKILLVNNKIKVENKVETYTLRRTKNTVKLTSGVNTMSCHKCGAPIDVTADKCEYCNSPIKYLQEWVLDY